MRRYPAYTEADERLYARWQAMEECGRNPHAPARKAARIWREAQARQGKLGLENATGRKGERA